MPEVRSKFLQNIDRRAFIGGSDARIIMGNDEAALARLWREKRGEAEAENLSDNLVVQLGRATEELNRFWFERNTGRQIRDVQRYVRHSAIPWMAATLDGIVDGTEAVFEAKFMAPLVVLRGDGRRKVHGPGPAQHVGHASPVRGAFHHHGRWQMGRDRHPYGPALSEHPGCG